MDRFKAKFASQIPVANQIRKDLTEKYGNVVIDTVTVSQVVGGMKDITCLLTETSLLDANEGIRFRGYSIAELQTLLPRVVGDSELLPEGIFLLMLYNELPSADDVHALSREWASRATVAAHVWAVLDTLPISTHPMTQFVVAINAMQIDSKFAEAYAQGKGKSEYWSYTYEDAMNLIARLPHIAAYIYRRTFFGDKPAEPNPELDWGGNFAHMMKMESNEFKSLMRLYLSIHADHEGGNASAHTCHLVGSTLADPYLSFAAAMNALAGPLHGLANQEVIKWVLEMCQKLQTNSPSKEQIETYIRETLAQGRVIPGYGHAVLRKTDPRFLAQMDFCKRYFPDDTLVNVIWNIYEVAPKVLGSIGKIKNPWPNVDAHSGATLMHYGMTQYSFYTVLFGVSRALGVMASLCWSRALNFPLERPKSETFQSLKAIAEAAAKE